jgi:PAS domain S-box-containing protein
LQESEALSSAVLNSMMANIAVVDKHGTIIAINDGWARFAQENGCDPASPKVGVGANYLEVCARAVRDLVAEGQEISDGIKGVLAHSQAAFRHEYACHSPTEQRWFVMRVSPLNRADGGAVIAQFDITERKRAEEALFRSQEMLQHVLDNIPARVIWKDRNLVYLGCNSAAASDAGLAAPHEIIRKSDFDLAWKGSADAYRADDLAVMESGVPRIGFEEAMHRPDGTIGTLITSKLPLHDREGNIFGVMGTYEDITERKRAEQELRQSEARLRAILDATPFPVALVDVQDKNIEFWSLSALALFGRVAPTAAEWFQLAYPDPDYRREVLEQWEPALEQARRSGQVVNTGEYRVTCGDGSVRICELHATFLSDKLIVTFHDITARKEMDTKLLVALDRAEAGNRAKSDFFSVMSHELRTPLNGVLGFVQLLSDTPLDSEQKDYVETISKSGEHLLAIVTDILDFSSIEKGLLAIHVKPLAVADVVKTAADTVRKTAAEKGLELRCELAASVPAQITGDKQRIDQILINLLGNAVKFTAGGSVVLRVSRSGQGAWASRPCEEPVSKQAGRSFSLEEERVAPTAPGRSFLDFCVEDTGIGISPETLGRLFQPFVQADPSRTRSFGGTGLGLAISKRIAEAMGGSITVVSAPGKGSTFTFRLPLEISDGGMAAVPSHLFMGADGASPSSSGAETSMPLGSALVLVVDDDRVSRMLAGKMLQSLGCEAEFALDGAEAVQAFAPGKHLAILMDMAMPVLGGLEATKKIREIESGSRVPIIALTANVMPGDRERCLVAGMDDFLSKPFKRAELATVLTRLPACASSVSEGV